MHHGLWAAAASYIIWGLFPLYFHQLSHVPALEIVAHRSVWSLVFVAGVLAVQRRWAWLREALRQPKVLGTYAAAALLLSSNWLIYVWAVNHGHVLEASLGYFINPLVNVLLGVLVLHERPRKLQWLALGVAAVGVLWMAVAMGTPPWVALALALSFGFYGLIKKMAPLGSLEGLSLETLLLAPVAIPALMWLTLHHAGGGHSPSTWAWLLVAGPLTAIPLLLFGYGAQRVSMGTLGLLQYLAPSLQFVLGWMVFQEPLSPQRLLGFVMIWAALALYSLDSWRTFRARERLATAH
ncbi:EamA family transporter RarD [Ideonella paludis]|uniref:EamA family transporter RarD n=1 Tax=Ideonella paludis TaxID=1233411 RepID=A0ABS5E2G2_9BURK|nr:EamA family transporter RarD [Ideonella paludis]MBQ0937602.1 EamA family transporter RarD [Ideonella paludis]